MPPHKQRAGTQNCLINYNFGQTIGEDPAPDIHTIIKLIIQVLENHGLYPQHRDHRSQITLTNIMFQNLKPGINCSPLLFEYYVINLVGICADSADPVGVKNIWNT